MTKFRLHYARRLYAPHTICPSSKGLFQVQLRYLNTTHVCIPYTVELDLEGGHPKDSLDEVWSLMQDGVNWRATGLDVATGLGVAHSSMSVGDVISYTLVGGPSYYYVVSKVGFSYLGHD